MAPHQAFNKLAGNSQYLWITLQSGNHLTETTAPASAIRPAFTSGSYKMLLELSNNQLDSIALYGSQSHPLIVFGAASQLRYKSHVINYRMLLADNLQINHKPLDIVIRELVLECGEMPVIWTAADKALLNNLFRSVMSEYNSSLPGRLELITYYLHLLLMHLWRLSKKPPEYSNSFNQCILSERVPLENRFKAEVQRHITASEVNDAARKVNFYATLLMVHPNYLNAVVKKNTGYAAINIIHRQIIIVAKSLLLQTNLSVKEIAYHLAFREPAHFTVFFRKHTYQTPVAYRLNRSTPFC